jgi:Tat protein translocase TatB subunit
VFGIGGTELAIIFVVAFLLFGPDKLPQMARQFGRLMREFNRAKDNMESTIRAEIYQSEFGEGLTDLRKATEPAGADSPAKAASTDWAADEQDEEDEE